MEKVFRNINTFKKWKELAEHYKFKCVYCGLDFLSSLEAYSSAEVDHFWPKKLSGTDSAVVPACRLCNSLKRAKEFQTIEEARVEIKRRREEYLKKYEFEELRAKYRNKKE